MNKYVQECVSVKVCVWMAMEVYVSACIWMDFVIPVGEIGCLSVCVCVCAGISSFKYKRTWIPFIPYMYVSTSIFCGYLHEYLLLLFFPF